MLVRAATNIEAVPIADARSHTPSALLPLVRAVSEAAFALVFASAEFKAARRQSSVSAPAFGTDFKCDSACCRIAGFYRTSSFERSTISRLTSKMSWRGSNSVFCSRIADEIFSKRSRCRALNSICCCILNGGFIRVCGTCSRFCCRLISGERSMIRYCESSRNRRYY